MQAWQPVDTERTIHTALYGFSAGKSRTTLIPLRAGAVVVFSPGRGLADAAAPLLEGATDIVLLAPSAGHTLGIAEWLERYPGATVVAAPEARARIQRHSPAEVGGLDGLSALLPPGVSVHRPPVRRLGEVWLRIERPERVYWVVCDAFMNAGPLTGSWLARQLKRLYRVGPGLEMTRLFVWNISDRAAFRAWVAERVRDGDALVPCHGEIGDAADMGGQVRALVEKRCC